ncbi:MAG TPA: NAD(P)/FAD-dependent oxidoreductase [Methylotenera sp.]|nr:NAD(P)/FAD-dependent oxidoreductase [Methylotenera sp.]
MTTKIWDVIIVGGGPAGLNAALVLGRCRRTVLLFDDGKPRNAVSRKLHGFLSRDGIDPAELRKIARSQLSQYPTVTQQKKRVVKASVITDGFAVETQDGETFKSRRLLLAGGVVDILPEHPGFRELYGIGVFVCPYCDGWEMRDKPIAVYGRGDDKGAGLALEMQLWSDDVVLCTDGPADLSQESRQQLERNHIPIREEKISHLAYDELKEPYETSFEIIFESGKSLNRNAIFFNTTRLQSNDLATQLGCDTCDPKACNIDNNKQMTNVAGLYIAGDSSGGVLQSIVAAAEGVKAAIAINTALLNEMFI